MSTEYIILNIESLGVKKRIPKFVNGLEFATQIPTIKRAINGFSASESGTVSYKEEETSLSGIGCYMTWKKAMICGETFKAPSLSCTEWKHALFFAVHMGDDESFLEDDSILPSLDFFGKEVYNLPLEALSVFVERYFTDCFYRMWRVPHVDAWTANRAFERVEFLYSIEMKDTLAIARKLSAKTLFYKVLSIIGSKNMEDVMRDRPNRFLYDDSQLFLDYVHPTLDLPDELIIEQLTFRFKEQVLNAFLQCKDDLEANYLAEVITIWNTMSPDLRLCCFRAYYDGFSLKETVCENFYEDWMYFFSHRRDFAFWIWDHVPRDQIAEITNSSTAKTKNILKFSASEFEKLVQRSKPKLNFEDDPKIKELRTKIANMTADASWHMVPCLEKAIEDRKLELKKKENINETKIRTSTGSKRLALKKATKVVL